MPPRWIPSFDSTMDSLSSDPKLSAEMRVAEALNKIASSDVWILHSLRYNVPKYDGNGAPTNREVDFLIVWKHRGFLILEVKGGRIDFEASERKWYRYPRNLPRNSYDESPVDQVNRQKDAFCKHTLPKFLPKELKARSIVERVLVFPDVSLSDFKDQRGQRPHRIDDFEIEYIADRELMPTLASFVEKTLEPSSRYVQQHKIPGKVFEDTVNFLRSDVRAEIPPRHVFENAEAGIKAVTDEQIDHLKHIMGTRLVLMDGPAGSAKTVLGLSAVLSWLESGLPTYYITANKYLVAGLRKDPRYAQVKEYIMSIHGFLEMALDAKIENTDDAMVAALTEGTFRTKGYCVVIDEAQDLDKDLYESIVSFLPCDRLWVLLDNRQSLDRENDHRRYDLGPLIYAMPYSLFKNCRNTRQIAEHIKVNVGLPNDYVNNIIIEGGLKPDTIMVASIKDQDEKLCNLLKLSEKEGYARENIVVLSCHAYGRDAVINKYCSIQGAKDFNNRLSYAGEDVSKVAVYHTLDFRGLESLYVIVTDIQKQESIFRAHYLSGSRAKVRLVLIQVEDESIRKAREANVPDDWD